MKCSACDTPIDTSMSGAKPIGCLHCSASLCSHECHDMHMEERHELRIYNEVYCKPSHRQSVEAAILKLALDNPSWGLDISVGPGDWEEIEVE